MGTRSSIIAGLQNWCRYGGEKKSEQRTSGHKFFRRGRHRRRRRDDDGACRTATSVARDLAFHSVPPRSTPLCRRLFVYSSDGSRCRRYLPPRVRSWAAGQSLAPRFLFLFQTGMRPNSVILHTLCRSCQSSILKWNKRRHRPQISIGGRISLQRSRAKGVTDIRSCRSHRGSRTISRNVYRVSRFHCP